MNRRQLLVDGFEEHRTHLHAVAHRMLGSTADADDAVQEAWLRLSRADVSEVQNLGGWLTTVIGRICLDTLRKRTAHREDGLDDLAPSLTETPTEGSSPEHEALLADSVGLAMLVVMDALTPAERLAFVLRDMFDVSYEEIAAILERTPAATKMLASRARHRVRAANPVPDGDSSRHMLIVRAFLAASRGGDLDALISLLAPEVVMTADRAAVAKGATAEMRGSLAVARLFNGRPPDTRPALIDGRPGAEWARPNRHRFVFVFTVSGDKIVAVELIGDPARVAILEVTYLTD